MKYAKKIKIKTVGEIIFVPSKLILSPYNCINKGKPRAKRILKIENSLFF
jgi:hypothetical protein